MSLFWQGFVLAVALIAVGVIALAIWSHRRSERRRERNIDAIIAKVAAERGSAGHQQSDFGWQGKDVRH